MHNFLNHGDLSLNTEQLLDYWKILIDKYPIISIEDPFDEDDINGFSMFTNTFGNKVQIVGDDLFVTSEKKLIDGINQNAGN